MSDSNPLAIFLIITVIIVSVLMGFMNFQQIYEQQNAPITCHQLIDYNDKQNIPIRNGNSITGRTVYNGYDICSYKNGTEFSNKSLGYYTELEFALYWV
jgi:hypothetical protein